MAATEEKGEREKTEILSKISLNRESLLNLDKVCVK